MDVIISFAIGVSSAVVTVVLLQQWPTRYRWASRIERSQGDRTGKLIYRAKLYRPRRPWAHYLPHVFDVDFHARVVLDPRQNEKLIEIPVSKEWRPRVGGAVMTELFAALCDPRDLRHWPTWIQDKRRRGTLTLDDLLSVPNTTLRMYVFAYRPYSGTRLVMFHEYDRHAVRSGNFQRRDQFDETDTPPLRTESEPPSRYVPATDGHHAVMTVKAGRWKLAMERDST